MIEFSWPWVFLALPLPFVWRLSLKETDPTRGAALRVPAVEVFEVTGAKHSTSRLWPLFIAGMAWLLLVTAGARPAWVGEPVDLPRSGRDLMLAVDISGSMAASDFDLQGVRVDRLTATKFVAKQFIDKREGDRIGLILFGSQAYLQTPLTFDRDTVTRLLSEAVIGLAGRQTAIGDAIGLAIKRLRESAKADRILILLTDGSNTAGQLKPVKAAQLASELEVTIYTIGIGADEIYERTFLGTRRRNPSADLDERTLRQIADVTNGQYFRARDVKQLERIYDDIDALEPVEQDMERFRPVRALFFWPLTLAVILGGALASARAGGRLP